MQQSSRSEKLPVPRNSGGRAGGASNSEGVGRIAKVLDAIVFLGLLVVITITVLPYGTVDAWWEALFESFVFILTAIWLIEVLLSGGWQIRRLVILVPIMLLTAFAFFQTVQLPDFLLKMLGQPAGSQRTITIDRYQTYITAVKLLALTLFTALLLLHTTNARRFYWLVRVVIGLGVGSAVFGIMRQMLQAPDSMQGFILPFLFYGMGYGQFLSPNAFAYLMEMSFGLTLGLVLGGGVRRDHIPLYLAAAALIWTALILSNSRGGMMALVCQSVFLVCVSVSWYFTRRMALGDGQKKWFSFIGSSIFVRVLLIVLIVGTLFSGILWMSGDRLAAKQAFNEKSTDGTTRKEIWNSSWKLIKQHPWTGVGFGAYFLAIPEFQGGSGRLKVEQAHNDYLDLAANGGILAVALAGWFVGMVLWRARFSLKSADSYRKAACLGALAGILSVGVHSVVDFGLQLTGIAVVFAALIVIAIADSRVESASIGRFPARRAENRS